MIDYAQSTEKLYRDHMCFCIGPQNGEPLCPCRMKSVIIQNGRYVEIRDLGPVKITPTLKKTKKELWNRCDVCGRFISYKDFENKKASRQMIKPDSLCSSETYETLCEEHNDNKI